MAERDDALLRDVGDAEVVRAAFEQMPVILVAARGPDLRLVAANALYRALVGRSGFIGRPAREVLPDLAGQQVIEVADRVLDTGVAEVAREWRLELERVPGEREELFVDFTFVPHRERGTVTGVDIMVVDATDRVRVRQATRREQNAVQQRYEQARATIDTLQRELLPAGVPVLPGVQIAASYLLAEEGTAAGGDWFDAVPLPGGKVALVVGDVVGHGVAASATMGQLRTVLRHVLSETANPVYALAALDRAARSVRGARATTVCVAVLDPAEGSVRYCTAGHPPPLVLPGTLGYGAEPRFLALTGSGPLGTGSEFGSRTEQLMPGEVLLLYTDGVLERPGRSPAASSVEFSQVADDVAAGRALDGSGAGTVDRVSTQTLELLVRATGHTDDITLLAAQRVPRTPGFDLRQPAEPGSLSEVRARLGAWLDALGVGAEDGATLQYGMGELLTNAMEHAYADGEDRDPLHIAARLTPEGEAVLSVTDTGRWREPLPRAGRGLGLSSTSRLVDTLRVETRHSGTTATLRHRLVRPARLIDRVDLLSSGGPTPPARPSMLFVLPQPERGLGRHRIAVEGPVDAATAPVLEQELLVATAAGTRGLTVDLSGVTHLASAGVSILHRVTDICLGNSSALRLYAPPGCPAQQILALTALPHHTSDPDPPAA